jgi:hypothetical protein
MIDVRVRVSFGFQPISYFFIQVVIFSKHHVEYSVKVYSDQNSEDCYEFGEVHGDYARSFHCEQTFDVSSVSISNEDTSLPLMLCEVAVYTMGKNT